MILVFLKLKKVSPKSFNCVKITQRYTKTFSIKIQFLAKNICNRVNRKI